MDTLGGLVDKLFTVDLKMWNNQELLYKIRHLSFEEFEEAYGSTEGLRVLWIQFKSAMDLNLQRNVLIDEIDLLFIDTITKGVEGEELDNGRLIQRKHKTY